MYREIFFGLTCGAILMGAGLLPTPTEMRLAEKVPDISLADIKLPDAPVIMSSIASFVDDMPDIGQRVDVRPAQVEPARPMPAPRNVAEVVTDATTLPTAVAHTVYFDLDQSELDAASRSVLEQVAASLVANDGGRVVIIGHTDLTGTEQYNLQLGHERAERVADFLAELGLPADRVDVIASYGEEQPVVKTEEPSRENRRVQIVSM